MTESLLIKNLREKKDLDLSQAEYIVLHHLAHLPTSNQHAALQRMRYLESKAQPFNWAWQELETIWGYSMDRSERDYDLADINQEL